MEKLHPGAKWLFRLSGIFVFVFLLIMFFSFSYTASASGMSISYMQIFVPALILLIVIVEIFSRWAYSNWKYEFTKDSLKIEKGVIVKRYKSIPYERIQNVDITRGILARIIGFSTLDIQTAGYGAYYKGNMAMSEGHIPAVSIEDAEKIRDFLMKKISGKKSGL